VVNRKKSSEALLSPPGRPIRTPFSAGTAPREALDVLHTQGVFDLVLMDNPRCPVLGRRC